MKQLWAPWRMDYILAEKRPGCFLCDAIHSNEDRDNLVIQRRQHCFVIMNRYPYNNGHVMIVPYRHVAAMDDLEDSEMLEIMQTTRDCIDILRQEMRIHGANVGVNLGEAAGAGLKEHLHVHVVPRWHGDTNFMPVLGDTKVMPQALIEVFDQLQPAFQSAYPLST